MAGRFCVHRWRYRWGGSWAPMAAADRSSFHGIIGRSAAMQALFAEVERFASVDVPILIRGESGTGKELVAKAIQRLSTRRERPFEKLNCADLTRELLRSELFGHERGAFTGAVSRTAGLVTRLHGGTLFMDEIGELAPGTPRGCCSASSRRARGGRWAPFRASAWTCV